MLNASYCRSLLQNVLSMSRWNFIRMHCNVPGLKIFGLYFSRERVIIWGLPLRVPCCNFPWCTFAINNLKPKPKGIPKCYSLHRRIRWDLHRVCRGRKNLREQVEVYLDDFASDFKLSFLWCIRNLSFNSSFIRKKHPLANSSPRTSKKTKYQLRSEKEL